jgi:hypothetical protein
VEQSLAASMARCVSDRDHLPVNVLKLIGILKVALANDAEAAEQSGDPSSSIDDVRPCLCITVIYERLV